MGEIGQKYNRDTVEIDYEKVEYYKECFEKLISRNKPKDSENIAKIIKIANKGEGVIAQSKIKAGELIFHLDLNETYKLFYR